MPRRKKLERTLTRAPKSAVARGVGEGRLVKAKEWENLASDVWQSIISAIGTRAALEANLRTAYALTERDNMDGGVQDDPFFDSSDLTIPLVFQKIRNQRVETYAQTFVPDFYLFTGLDDQAQAFATDIQIRFNYDFRRMRGPFSSWLESHDKVLHMGLRDGTGGLEASWVKDIRMTRMRVETPMLDPDGLPMMDDETGDLQTEPQYVTMPVTVYDDVVLNPFLLKDCLLMPNESSDPEAAAAVAIYHTYYESDLRAMAEDGILDWDWCEKALAYDPQGFSDIASRFQGVYNYTSGGQIDVGVGQGQGISSDSFVNRGPLGVWVVYTRQYDLDADGIEEPNLIFIHETSGFMIGATADENMAPFRLIFFFNPYPRCDSPYGYGAPELIGPFQAEATLQWNQRNDAVSTRLEVPLLADSNVQFKDSGMSWANGRIWWVQGHAQQGALRDIIYYPQLSDVPLASYEQEQNVYSQADATLGSVAPGGGSRQSATQIKDTRASSDLGINDIAMRMRSFSRRVLEAIWSLKLQYGFNQDGTERNPPPGAKPLTKQMMMLHYKKQIAGEDDPLDKQAQLEEVLGWWKDAQNSPFIQSNLLHRYNAERLVASKFGITGLDSIYGTPDDVQKMMQQQAQVQQEKEQMEKQTVGAEIIGKLNRGRGGNTGLPLLTQVPPDLWQQAEQAQQAQQQQPQQQGAQPQAGAQ